MATILLHQGEDIDKGLRRFKRSASGLIREFRSRTSYLTKSQRRRAKSKSARTARRNLAVKLAIINRWRESAFRKPESLSYDVAWPVTGMDTHFDGETGERVIDHHYHENGKTRPTITGPAEAAGFGEDQRKLELPKIEKTYHNCVIAPIFFNGIPCIILIRSRNKDGTERKKFGAPGGALNKGEASKKGAKREFKEETGYDIRPLKNTDLIGKIDQPDHLSTCYAGTDPVWKTNEIDKKIIERKAFRVSQVYTDNFMQCCLLPKYQKYFLDYKEFLERKAKRTDLEEQVFQTILTSELYREEGVAVHV